MLKNKSFEFWNNLVAWVAFAISLIVYLLTLEPTVSYWDCGEFLSCARNLEVSHPPGAPLFMLLGRIASFFYPSNPTIAINALSAFASAFTVLFLFWTITWFARKLLKITPENNLRNQFIVLLAGFVGSLSFAFTDSFWFSAVETEVYGLSSMLTALVFWCILKWEEKFQTEKATVWLVLIAYLFGLSIGVHLLNLLVIPAIVAVFILKKETLNWKLFFKITVYSLMLLFVFLVVILKGIPYILSETELIAVNNLGLPFNSGFICATILILVIPWLFYYIGIKRKKRILAILSLCLSVVLFGLTTYAVIVVRSYQNPSIDMTNPETPFALNNYLSREQYGERPLLYGQSFNSPAVETKERFTYQRYQNKYVKDPLNPKVIYDPETLTLFPRMSSEENSYPEMYKWWIGSFHGKVITTNDGTTQLPSFSDNIRYFFTYQLGYMYFRYFMWNFSGKQNDIQGRGNALYGNWKSGFSIFDQIRLGDSKKVPQWLRQNKGNNSYFMIPLLLGLIGFYFQYKKDKNNILVTSLFFVLTGIAIVVYLNEVPVTPRERDYVYTGSFYIFSVWIGLSVLAILNFLQQKMGFKWAIALTSVITLFSPVVLLQQNFDDHNRSNRYAVLEYARNFLESCEPNAILFTTADNDTYPLWYAQEVEGIRRDIRLILTPYLSADWYVDQMRNPIFNQKGLVMKLSSDKYLGGKRNYIPIVEKIDSAVEISSVLDFIGTDNDKAKIPLQNGEVINYLPCRKLFVKQTDSVNAINKIQFNISSTILRMDEMVLLDIIANNYPQRPVYFTSEQTAVSLGFSENLQMDGYAYKLTPKVTHWKLHDEIGGIDTKSQYIKLMQVFSYNSLADSSVYLDNTHIYQVNVINLRNKFVRLAEALTIEGDTVKAEKVLDKIDSVLPLNRVPYDFSSSKMVEQYFAIGKSEKATRLMNKIIRFCRENLSYMNYLSGKQFNVNNFDVNLNLYLIQSLGNVVQKYQVPNTLNELQEIWNDSSNLIQLVQK